MKSMRIRQNVRNLGHDEKANFVNAIVTLKNRPSVLHADDTTKNRYDDYVEIHLNAMMAMSMTDPAVDPNWYPGWAHNGPAFFPWHRQLLLQFEMIYRLLIQLSQFRTGTGLIMPHRPLLLTLWVAMENQHLLTTQKSLER